jgi:hypothetical protein
MGARKACAIDETEEIDPPEEEPTPEEEEQAALEWLFDVAFPHLAPPEDEAGYPLPVVCSLGLEEDFESLCDATFDNNN